MHDDARAEVGADNGARVAEGGAVEFTVAYGHDFADSVHDGFSGGEGELFESGRGLCEFAGERNFVAPDERSVVEIEAAGTGGRAGVGNGYSFMTSPGRYR